MFTTNIKCSTSISVANMGERNVAQAGSVVRQRSACMVVSCSHSLCTACSAAWCDVNGGHAQPDQAACVLQPAGVQCLGLHHEEGETCTCRRQAEAAKLQQLGDCNCRATDHVYAYFDFLWQCVVPRLTYALVSVSWAFWWMKC